MSRPLRLIFMGTPDFAVPCLQALLEGPDAVTAVVCQPDRPGAAAGNWSRRRSNGWLRPMACRCCSRKA